MIAPLSVFCASILHQDLSTHPPHDPINSCGTDLGKLQTDPNELLRLADRELHVFPFRDVAKGWFRLFVDASLALAALRVVREAGPVVGARITEVVGEDSEEQGGKGEGGKSGPAIKPGWMDEVVAVLDRALIFAGGLGRQEIIHRFFEGLRRFDDENERTGGFGRGRRDERPRKRRKLEGGEEDESPFSSSLIDDVGSGGRQQGGEQDNGDADDVLPLHPSASPRIKRPVHRLERPSMAEFQKYMDTVKKPALLSGIMDHWPALKQWRRKSYWMRETFDGRRLVPVEVGRSYTDEDWGQRIMTFGDFMKQYILGYGAEREEEEAKPAEASFSRRSRSFDGGDDGSTQPSSLGKTGYLAQHDLFAQIPSLRSAIATPDYCYLDAPPPDPGTPVYLSQLKNKKSRNSPFAPERASLTSTPLTPPSTGAHTKTDTGPEPHPSNDENAARDPDVDDGIQANIWFGPAWTVSPLHHDPHHNILCQVVGTKYIRLYSPSDSSRLHPRSEKERAPHLRPSHSNNNFDQNVHATIDGVAAADEDAQTTSGSNPTAVESRKQPPERKSTVPEHNNPRPTNQTLIEKDTDIDTDTDAAAAATIDMSNTSLIDLSLIETSPSEDWDAVYPGLSTVPYVECILGASDALYIPVGWWHYVRSCSVGVSVSFWWGESGKRAGEEEVKS